MRAAFLSHSSEDSDLAQQLCVSLEKRGFDCWLAPRDLNLGESWALGCLRGIVESECLVLLASDKALRSVQVLSEVAQAHKRATPIYTVLIAPAEVKGEMDFYLSRLHWLPRGGRTPEELAGVLAKVLGKPEWEQTAAPPSLRRTIHHRPTAFLRLIAAATSASLLVLGTAAWFVNHALNQDFRRLGYVEMAESAESGPVVEAHAQIWLMAGGVPFRNVRLLVATDAGDAEDGQPASPHWAMPDKVGPGAMEPITLTLATKASRVTTCLTVLSAGLHGVYRITQEFALSPVNGDIRIAETAERRVSRENGSPCRAMHDK